jgi:hypothetical protein
LTNSKWIEAAARAHADWCHEVVTAHGCVGRFDERVWWCDGQPPEFHPSAITLRAGASPEDVVRGELVSDSWCALDLASFGYRPAFEATWLVRGDSPGLVRFVVTDADEVPEGQLVLYDREPAPYLEIGFRPLGPLRVWRRS